MYAPEAAQMSRILQVVYLFFSHFLPSQFPGRDGGWGENLKKNLPFRNIGIIDMHHTIYFVHIFTVNIMTSDYC